MNMVGTPCSAGAALGRDGLQHRQRIEAFAGITMQARWVRQARLPSTMPKQW